MLGGLDGDTPARAIVELQDREIGERSGRPRGRIKTITRSRKAKVLRHGRMSVPWLD